MSLLTGLSSLSENVLRVLCSLPIEPDDGLAPAPAAQLSALFARLPEMSSRQAIDKAAVEFTFLNSKAARRRLVKVTDLL